MIIAGNKWLKKSKSSFPGFTLGKKGSNMLVSAVNQIGFEIQEFAGPTKGWISSVEEQVGFKPDGDTPIYRPLVIDNRELAESMMEELVQMGSKKELRVYPVLAPKKRK